MYASSEKPYRTYQAPLTSAMPPEGLWQKVAMDIMGPFKTMNGKYAIVLVDYFSKWCGVEFVTDITMSRVIKFLHNVFVHEGYPNHIVLYNGVQFTSHKIKDYFAERGIVHSTSALYHPQAKGQYTHANFDIESANSVLKSAIPMSKSADYSTITAPIFIKQVHCSHSYLWPIHQKENQQDINQPSGYGALWTDLGTPLLLPLDPTPLSHPPD